MIARSVPIVVILTLTALLVSGCEKKTPEASPNIAAIPARVETPELRMITEWNEFTGRFQALDRVEIRSRVGGYLEEIRFKDGQEVKKGDVLFVVDQRPFEIELKSAEARFEFADKEFKRAGGLRKSNAISEEEYDQRIQEMRVAKAEMENARLNLEFSEIKAPFDGRISRNLVSSGSLISGGNANATHLATLLTVSPIEFYFEGSEADVLAYHRLRLSGGITGERGAAQPVYLKLQDEDNFVHEGIFNYVDNELRTDTGTMEGRAIFDNADGIFEPGMFGRMRATFREPSEYLVVPETIIGTEFNRKYVYALSADNKAVRKYVTLGQITEDGQRVIKSGLETNDRVVVGGLHMVRPNALISPITEDQVATQQEGK
ncbi:efflux RND transporter periplasmic adaptor subunit [Sessilibacter corallicola]|uniref:Efflux RND transporter periplasmic adaptor subunit n=1 Tax=Sessilibacter corallicola TaxID=2904075 RepID=A0ABQ0AEJ4_9GAMM